MQALSTRGHAGVFNLHRFTVGPHFSNASYSGDSMPAGLSAAMSGRAGAKRRVTARPTHFF